jgi:hypothetical protein
VSDFRCSVSRIVGILTQEIVLAGAEARRVSRAA